MISLTDFKAQNWLITPAALAVGERPPATIHEQKWLVVLSGVVGANLQGKSSAEWLRETVSILPDMSGVPGQPISGPLVWAINQYSIPTPGGPLGNYIINFSLQEWAPFASLSSIFDQDQSISAGFAVDAWRPTPFLTQMDALTHQPVGNIFAGINVDVGVRDTDASILRLGYQINLLGKIVFVANVIQ